MHVKIFLIKGYLICFIFCLFFCSFSSKGRRNTMYSIQIPLIHHNIRYISPVFLMFILSYITFAQLGQLLSLGVIRFCYSQYVVVKGSSPIHHSGFGSLKNSDPIHHTFARLKKIVPDKEVSVENCNDLIGETDPPKYWLCPTYESDPIHLYFLLFGIRRLVEIKIEISSVLVCLSVNCFNLYGVQIRVC